MVMDFVSLIIVYFIIIKITDMGYALIIVLTDFMIKEINYV
jgi:hypothetical protein